MNLCESNKATSLEVKNFMQNVSDIKEESITDYLVWKWRELDKRFNYINIKTFTRQQENSVTGADFELELWLIKDNGYYPFIFQAKKFIKQYDSYLSKLKYPKNTDGQLNKLMAYSNSHYKYPFYVFYSIPDQNTNTRCCTSNDTSIFIVDASIIKKFTNGYYGKKISKNDILEKSYPFHCIFCCTNCLNKLPPPQRTLPSHVQMLLENETPPNIDEIIKKHKKELNRYRIVAAYDMRNAE